MRTEISSVEVAQYDQPSTLLVRGKVLASTTSPIRTDTKATGLQTKKKASVRFTMLMVKPTRVNGSCLLNRLQDVKNGIGEYHYVSGAKFKGGWLNNLKHGESVTVFEDDTEYHCQFLNGLKHGKALIVSPDGKKMSEEYEMGKLVSRQTAGGEKNKKSEEDGSGEGAEMIGSI